VAKHIAEKYGLRYISSGELFRKIALEKGVTLEELSVMAEKDPSIDLMIDDRMKQEGSRLGSVGDALLSGWLLKDIADIKIWFKAPLDTRVRRIADRERRPYEEVYKETVRREESERYRFKKYYSIDIDDLSIYDYVISTHKLDLESVIIVVDDIIDGYLRYKGRMK
jgi:cytidylate kinase